MQKKKLIVNLSEASIDKAINELKIYKSEFLKKLDLLRKRIADYIAKESQLGFDSAILNDEINGTGVTPDVNVTVDDKDNVTLIIANGEDAVWVEFGAGVYHNTSVGGSLHPRGEELGFTIGSYGQGKGHQKIWGYYDNGLHLTHGTPASMPMEKSFLSAMDKISEIINEVFG